MTADCIYDKLYNPAQLIANLHVIDFAVGSLHVP